MKTYHVTGLEQVNHLYYYLKPPVDDYISEQIRDFKKNNTIAKETLIKRSVDELAAKQLRFDYVVRALGSKETSATGTPPLRDLGLALAKITNAAYAPSFIKKRRVTEPLKFLNRARRYEVMSDNYYLDSKHDLTGLKILVIDDITTTGSSLAAIARCIKQSFNAQVYGFCLGHTVDFEHQGVSCNSEVDESEYKEVQKDLTSENTKAKN